VVAALPDALLRLFGAPSVAVGATPHLAFDAPCRFAR
jgi:hypothetical protein